MTTRMNLAETNKDGYRKVLGLEQYSRTAVEPHLYELLKLRASQLNGCAYCVDMHAVDMQKAGTADRKIFAVAAWHESPFFDERERLTLELTEAVTAIADGVDDDLWERAVAEFGEKTVGDLILAIATINVWNRIGVSTRLTPPPLG